LGRSVTPDVGDCLELFLLGQLFSLLLLLLHLKALRRLLKLLFVHHKEVARPAL
jgi:hypothetical protein